MGSICRQQLFRSLRAHQRSSNQMKILKDQSAQATTRTVGIAYRLWLPFKIDSIAFRSGANTQHGSRKLILNLTGSESHTQV